MRCFDSLTAERILSVTSPEAMYSNNLNTAKREYRSLVRLWHPDFRDSKESSKVLSHILELYKCARAKIASGSWEEPFEKVEEETPGIKKILRSDHNVYSFKYSSSRLTDTGSMYISDHCVMFELAKEFEELYARGCKNIHGLTFASQDMAAEISRYLPEILDSFYSQGKHYCIVRKTPDQLLLSDVVSHFGGKIQPIEHMGWILNCLYNLCCYLEWVGISHNAINLNNLWISPLRHDLMLLGGWWFSARLGEEIIAVPTDSLKVIPQDVIESKIASNKADLELVKSVGRAILGDPDGILLRHGNKHPESLVDWLLKPATSSAIREYETFKYEVLELAFGLPRFVDLRLTSRDLYEQV